MVSVCVENLLMCSSPVHGVYIYIYIYLLMHLYLHMLPPILLFFSFWLHGKLVHCCLKLSE
ncbi:hypothetical protein, unlikely [Trypanosoma brucei brucei TREU927]|uniref:Uncharacterized protein n=1 Tax=Trypanosoma brucei brucei (strain 927/4 GUTat10.1) TaxID=185431 RepID=Q4GYG1_TRYB2|nr:hypothetical protein, unlikely [Trypanosoma brucei brucei TREU927]CAJ16623.1 hypothetical protein, unlikely [Trypanosoma brucei brucei TREU927]